MSWVLPKDTNDLELLKHERLHFDIAELFARYARKQFRTLKPFCSNIRSFKGLLRDYQIEADKENLKYDAESNHYKNKEMQEKWSKDVARRLKELAEYRI